MSRVKERIVDLFRSDDTRFQKKRDEAKLMVDKLKNAENYYNNKALDMEGDAMKIVSNVQQLKQRRALAACELEIKRAVELRDRAIGLRRYEQMLFQMRHRIERTFDTLVAFMVVKEVSTTMQDMIPEKMNAEFQKMMDDMDDYNENAITAESNMAPLSQSSGSGSTMDESEIEQEYTDLMQSLSMTSRMSSADRSTSNTTTTTANHVYSDFYDTDTTTRQTSSTSTRSTNVNNNNSTNNNATVAALQQLPGVPKTLPTKPVAPAAAATRPPLASTSTPTNSIDKDAAFLRTMK